MQTIKISLRSEGGPSILPVYSTSGAAGADVRAWIAAPISLKPGERLLVPTGLWVEEIPVGFEIQVRPRSGLAFKHGITVLNAPGTIDADYRGEIRILLINHSQDPFLIEPQMRIGQLVVASVVQGEWCAVEPLMAESNKTSRGAGGFGHTGTH